jgi:hypothetical protein
LTGILIFNARFGAGSGDHLRDFNNTAHSEHLMRAWEGIRLEEEQKHSGEERLNAMAFCEH